MELSTERQSGMSVGSIPIGMIWKYIDRFDLPDYWEPILLQVDAALVAEMNGEHDGANKGVGKEAIEKHAPIHSVGKG